MAKDECPVDHTNPEIVAKYRQMAGEDVTGMSKPTGSAGPAASECPVDHTNPEIVAKYRQMAGEATPGVSTPAGAGPAGPAGDAPVAPTAPATECPVDHTNPEIVAKFLGKDHGNGGEGLPPLPNIPAQLSSDREVSSIPRFGSDKNWVYPSEQQFFSAMKRKKFDPNAGDMPVIIPIHNAVNERCWSEVLRWERGHGAEACGGPELVKFEGDSSKLTPKAWLNMWVFGATRPFDRHDWTIDRCGVKLDYVIDFYSGKPDPRFPERQSFYLDVRPKLNSWEGIKMRVWKWLSL